MIGFLRGKIIEMDQNRWIVGSDVGYSVLVPGQPEYTIKPLDSTVELFIHTEVRETAIDLFGFITRSEKELFQTLLNINGLGPKACIQLLSAGSPGALMDAIFNGDRDYLVKIPGVGKKTAERILLEAKDPLKKKQELGRFPDLKKAVVTHSSQSKSTSILEHQERNEAKLALLGLGYREPEIETALQQLSSGSDLENAEKSTQAWIKKALKLLNRNLNRKSSWNSKEL